MLSHVSRGSHGCDSFSDLPCFWRLDNLRVRVRPWAPAPQLSAFLERSCTETGEPARMPACLPIPSGKAQPNPQSSHQAKRLGHLLLGLLCSLPTFLHLDSWLQQELKINQIHLQHRCRVS